MNILSILDDPQALLAFSAALAVFTAILTVSWPYLARDNLSSRMRQVANERERIRARERAKLKVSQVNTSTLKSEPKKVFKDIVDRFNLTKQAGDGSMINMLRQAGFRGQNPIFAFLAFRVIMPLLMFTAALVYLFVLIELDKPFLVKLTIAVVAAYAGYYAPTIYVKNLIYKRQKSIRRAWPDALDLLLICVESGMGIEPAFRKVSEEIGPQSLELAEEISLTTAEMSYLADRRKAYENLGKRTGLEAVRSVVTSLIQSDKYGTPVGVALRVLAQESRDMRMMEAEKKAAGLPPKLTVPMILFFLPVLFAVIITPAALQVMAIE
jgi:tight adherence protein C